MLGGALFLMPIVVLTVFLNKAFDFARRELKPIAKLIPDQLVSEATTETAMAIALIVILCLLAGLLGRTVLTQKIMSRLESAMLSNVPAYGYLKQAGSSMKGLGEIAEPRGARASVRRPSYFNAFTIPLSASSYRPTARARATWRTAPATTPAGSPRSTTRDICCP